MHIAPATAADLSEWSQLRTLLWPQSASAEHRQELEALMSAGDPDLAAFVARDGAGQCIGFAEASLRHDPVNGCDTSPVVFLEGVFVLPDYRRSGIAGGLVAAVEAWGRHRGCTEMGSDALLENLAGQAFHKALGFVESERVIIFRKLI